MRNNTVSILGRGSDVTPPTISAVLPAYNEEAAIRGAVVALWDQLRALVGDGNYEIIIVDDGSRDGTGRALRALQQRLPELPLRVVTHERNRGYGAALASGFDTATMELIFFTDGDLQFDVAELARFLPAMDGRTDMVIGYRARRADPPLRLLNALGWKILVNNLFGYAARDVDCAFKLFRRAVWTGTTVRSRGAAFSSELLVKARRLGFRVKELPVSHYPRKVGSPTGAKPTVILRALREIALLRLRLDQDLAADRARRAVAAPIDPPLPRAA
jgi:glycosyltransferase involved in cell wall biosynthesis